MSEDYHTRAYTHGDEEGIIPLLDEVFHGWPRMSLTCSSMEHWRWKYQKCSQGSVIAVTLKDGQVVGCHHGPVFNVKLMDGSVLETYGTDLAVHPRHRRRGIMLRQIKQLNSMRDSQKVNLSLVLAVNPVDIQSVEKRRPRFPLQLVNMVKITDIDRQLEAIPMKRPSVMKLGFQAATVLCKLKHIGARHQGDVAEVVDVQRFGEEADTFWSRIEPEYDFITRRDRGYLNWRFLEPEAGPYVVKAAMEGDEMLGYVIQAVNSSIEGYPVGFIVDLQALPGRVDVAEALIRDAVQSFNSAGVNVVNYLCFKGHRYMAALERTGFLDSRVGFHLFYRYNGDTDPVKRLAGVDPCRCCFNWSDHDTLPVKLPAY